MPAALNIAALSRRTGIAPDTLRKWEQRYGVLRPVRTTGGQRRYTELDVARVEWLRDRLGEGYRIGEAAAMLGTSAAEATRTPDELRDAIFRAIADVDAQRLEALLDQAFGLHPTERALGEIVAPVLRRVGDEWERGVVSVGQEHLFSNAVRTRLERMLADARGDVRGLAVLACAPGELHELGLMMLAVLMRADGWQIAYLGPDTPLSDAVELAHRLDASLLAISVGMAEHLRPLRALDLGGNGIRFVLGGAAASRKSAREVGADWVDGDLPAAVERLRANGA